MGEPQRKILFSTFLVSCISFSLLVLSITTAHWINGEAVPADNSLGVLARVNYGLISGTITRQDLTSQTDYDLKMTCLFSENICMQSCQPTQESREREVLLLLYGKTVASSCDGVESSDLSYPEDGMEDRRKLFIKAKLYISTWVLLVLSLILSFLTVVFSAVNVTGIFSFPALRVWNSLVANACLITLILWLVQFQFLKRNLAIQDTLRLLRPYLSAGNTNLGFSYYLVLIAMILQGSVNVALLYWRQRRISREQKEFSVAGLWTGQIS